MSQTLMHINNLTWIVIEDDKKTSDIVEALLIRSNIDYIYFAAKRNKRAPHRGWTARDAALSFLRKEFRHLEHEAVVYFGDDDNTYDIRLFDNYIRNVQKVGVWAVGIVAKNLVEAPKVVDGALVGWLTNYAPNRKWGLDMAGFAVNLNLILTHNNAVFLGCTDPSPEPCLLDKLEISKSDVEPFGYQFHQKEILVYHTRTQKPLILSNKTYGYEIEIP